MKYSVLLGATVSFLFAVFALVEGTLLWAGFFIVIGLLFLALSTEI